MRALGNGDIASDARIYRVKGRQPELIARRSRRALIAAVAVVVQIGVDHRGVWLSALRVESAGELPSAQQYTRVAAHVAGVVIELPHAAEDEPIAHVVVTGSAIERDMQRIIDHLAVVSAGHNRSRVRSIVNHMAPGI